MYHIICCMKSKDSYKRIIEQYERANIEWEDFISDLDEVKSKFTVTEYDYAVVDMRLWWKSEAIEFFQKQEIQTILFQGDFEEILNQLSQNCTVENDPETDKKTWVPESSTQPSEAKVNYIERPVRVEVPVYKPVFTSLSNQLILIANLSERAGSTFITLNLAKLLSNLKILSCVIEPPVGTSYIYEAVNLKNKIKEISASEDPAFVSYPHLINEGKKPPKDSECIYDSIIWLVPDPRLPVVEDWNFDKMMKLIYATKKASTYLIDCGSNLYHESLKPMINEADLILIVVDPMPVECMHNKQIVDEMLELKRSGLPIEFIVNKFTSGVKKDELNDYLRIQPLAYIPAIDTKYIQEAAYSSIMPIENKAITELFNKPFYNIVKRMIPKDLLKSYFEAAITSEEQLEKPKAGIPDFLKILKPKPKKPVAGKKSPIAPEVHKPSPAKEKKSAAAVADDQEEVTPLLSVSIVFFRFIRAFFTKYIFIIILLYFIARWLGYDIYPPFGNIVAHIFEKPLEYIKVYFKKEFS